jgi:hypothetical protein
MIAYSHFYGSKKSCIFYFIIYIKQPPIQGYYLLNRGRDGHGCLVNSGFKWDNSTQNCLKKSSNSSIIYQVTDFRSCLAAGYAINEDNKTRDLQCQSSNGTLFKDNSVVTNSSSKDTLIKFPDSVIVKENLTITDVTNITNSS